jgi:nitrate/nitrite-specific signal transduction histidine kinase
MRTTADEAYQQVRSTLNELNPIQPTDLTTMVLKQALAISKRSGFNLRTNQMGSPFALPAEVRQQILYIAREALHNIEKHARANRVIIQYLWLEHELIMKINDDGVGFDPRSVPVEGHYGLWIMQNRAIEIGGTLKINRLDEPCGTEVTLWVPRPKYSPVQKHDVYAVK